MNFYTLYLIRFAERYCTKYAKSNDEFISMFKRLVFGMDYKFIAGISMFI